jgi:hypothetical protein
MKNIEIGSFLELDLRNSGEYYVGDDNTARLNSGRSGIFHALRLMNCNIIYLPTYLCPDVRPFLEKESIRVKPYNISDEFEPLIDNNERDTSILIVNYFGLFSVHKLLLIRERFNNVIIDNCSAFFMQSLTDCFNIYSCRKFFGVPDGCYVVGPEAGSKVCDYHQDFSSNTSAYLLMRIEKGCSATYEERMKNEDRLNSSGVLKMSVLTRALMYSLDYEFIKNKRKENFKYACSLYKSFNLINPERFSNEEVVPMFYPLVVRDEKLVEKLKVNGIYTGRRWSHVINEVKSDSFEALLSAYMVPIPIDQRYGAKELDYCFEVFKKVFTV